MVRLLAVADIHSRASAIDAIRDGVSRHAPDATVVAGDLTNYGDAAEVARVLDSLPGRVLAIPGNLDVSRAFEAGISKSHAENLVGNLVKVQGVSVAGLCDSPKRELPCDVLVLHEPPFHILDDVGGGRHIGLQEHLEALHRLKPKLVLCGHCHESPGVENLDQVVVVNCTLGRGGRGALIEIHDGKVSARLL
jgi:Icc-related predicted phosphoesterase